MLFNSFEFVAAFLPIVLAGYHLISRLGRPNFVIWFLVAASLFFYGWWNWVFVWLLISLTGVNYLFGLMLERWRSRVILVGAIAFNLGILGWYKYAVFFVDTWNAATERSLDIGEIVLPLAISFFTFQKIVYLVDVYNGVAAERNPGRFALFVTFFPQLIAGPIVHPREVLPQYGNPDAMRLSWDNLAVGVSIFAIGLFKKVVFADSVGEYADLVFGTASHGDPVTFVSAWTGVGAFALQIYFDFSGYSDMAIGLARMFGIRLPLNFESPYKAASIVDFWRRWHMTLSRFLRDYLYIPLGGNRKGTARRYVNLMIVMLLGGLWHGAAWTFVAWGALHGIYLAINYAWRAGRRAMGLQAQRNTMIGRAAGRALTLVSVLFAWCFFRAENWDAAMTMLAGLTGAAGIFLPESYAYTLGPAAPILRTLGVEFGAGPDPAVFPTLSGLAQIVALFVVVLFAPNTQEWMERTAPALDYVPRKMSRLSAELAWRPSVASGIAVAVIFSVALGKMLNIGNHDFIYFQF